jgi:hypothetical protein
MVKKLIYNGDDRKIRKVYVDGSKVKWIKNNVRMLKIIIYILKLIWENEMKDKLFCYIY